MVKKNLSLVECIVLNCRDVEDLVGPYIDGDLDVELKSRVDAHLSECGCCKLLVTDLQTIVTDAKTLNDRPVPPDVSRRLRAALSQKLGIELGSSKPQLMLLKPPANKPE